MREVSSMKNSLVLHSCLVWVSTVELTSKLKDLNLEIQGEEKLT